jgi:hypothetical protein
MTGRFDLRALVRQVVDADSTGDRSAMTAEVRKRIPAGSTEAALSQALAAVVREEISHGWRRPLHVPARPASARRAKQQQQPSRKVAVIRTTWRTRLDTVMYTIADGSTRRLGDMTVEDLKFVAAGLREQADALNRRARLLDKLIDAMNSRGAATVRDLDDADLQPLAEAA